MAEYISREASLEAQNKSMNLAECRKRLERIPAADVREVVKCENCAVKYEWPWCGMFPNDGYCSAGIDIREIEHEI